MKPDREQEMAEDVCQVCKVHLGYGVRFMHLGLCEKPACRRKVAKKKEMRDGGQRPAR